MRASGRFSPLTGLEGARQAEQFSAGKIPMRGGFNMTPVDGEWWSRNGRPVLENITGDNPPVIAQLGNIQWNGILSTNSRDYIWSPDYVLDINSEGLVNQAYWESAILTGNMVAADPGTGDPALPWFQYGGTPSPTTPQEIFVGDLLLTGPAPDRSQRGDYGQCYRVIAEENDATYGRIAYLDRYWTSPTNTPGSEPTEVRVIPSLRSIWTAGTGSGPTVDHQPPAARVIIEGSRAGATTFDQLVTFDADSSALESVTSFLGRRTYLVITASTLEKPVAILLDSGTSSDQSSDTALAVPRQYWFRDTSVSFTGADSPQIPHPYFCCASNGRVIIGRAQDHQGGFESRTIWYSGRGNITVWHTGVQNETSAPNYVTFDQSVGLNDIRGLLPLGNRFVVHRRHSQMVASYTGANESPFAITENSQDIGLEAYGAVVLAGGAHFFPTDAGPAAFDGQSVTPLGGEIRAHLVTMGFWFGEPFAVGHDRERKLIYFFTSHVRQQDVIPSPAGPIYAGLPRPPAPTPPENRVVYESPGTRTPFYSAAPTLVYSMDRQAWFFDDQPSLGALGQVKAGGTWGLRLDGTILNLNDGTVPGAGLDAAVDCSSQYGSEPNQLSRILIPAAPVDAFVESPWISFGTLERKMVTKILLQLRAWPATDVYDSDQDIMHGCTLDILTNGDATVVRETIQVSYKVEVMRSLDLDENRQQPLMLFELSPRVSGENFKFIFRNALPVGSTHKKGPMRVANFEVFYDQDESNRPLTSMGKQ